MQRKSMFSKDFTLVAMGQIISIFGNQILRYALPLYLLQETGSATLFGIILASSFVPMLLLFPIGGIIADRVNKRNIMVVLDFATAGLVFLFYLLAGRMEIVPLMAVTMTILYGIQGTYQPAVKASVPALVDSDHLMGANSVVDLISSLGSMAGPVIGGILFSVFGLSPILLASTGCFLVSAVMEIFIHIPHKATQATGNILATGLEDLRESFHFLFHRQPILWKVSLIYASVGLFLTALSLIAVPVLITQHLGFSPDTASRLYGYAQGSIAAGAILGGLLAGVFSRKLKPGMSPFLLLGCALSMLAVGAAQQTLGDSMQIYLVLITGCGLLVALSTVFQIQIMSCLQVLTPGNLIGKVVSCFMCLCMCTSPLGQLLYGIVFEKMGNFLHLPFYVASLSVLGIIWATRRTFRELEQLVEQQANTPAIENHDVKMDIAY